MNIKRLLLLAVLSTLIISLIQIGCDELITEQTTIIEAGHPIANFSLISPTDGMCCAPCDVIFKDSSDGPRQIYTWNFGDDSILTETLPPDPTDYEAPTHTYETAGIYTVSLSIRDTVLGGQDIEIRQRYLIIGTVPASFQVDPVDACVGQEVDFTLDEYTIENTYQWDFGDGSDPVTGLNPSHTFAAEGTYTVKLTTVDATCGEDSNKVDVVVSQCPLVAFDADVTSGCVPLDVTFSNSTNLYGKTFIERLWEFGDGGTSTDRDPVYSYTTGGGYTVTLTVTTDAGTSTDSIENFINPVDATLAEFDIEGDASFCFSPTQDFQVNFLNQSLGLRDSVRWYFGDGTTDTNSNPIYIYTVPGIYDVTLEAYGLCGADTIVKDSYIVLSDVLLDENLVIDTVIVSGGGAAPSTYTISDISTIGVITGRVWYVDDVAEASDVTEFTHIFDEIKTYTVKLEATNDCGTATQTIDIVIAAP